MNFKEIKELIQILDESSLTEINIEDNKGSVVNLKTKRNWNYYASIFTTTNSDGISTICTNTNGKWNVSN